MGLHSFSLLRKGIKYFVFERTAKKYSLPEHIDRLSSATDPVAQRMAAATDTEAHRQKIAHIIGMERWGQRRLRIGLGEPPISDEHDGYCPASTLSPAELQHEFQTTRQATLEVARKLLAAGVKADFPHNTFGPISLAGWLVYLKTHADRESKRLKS